MAVLCLLSSVLRLRAQSIWNGGGADNNWSTGANWGGTAPVSDPSTALQFAGTTRLTPNTDSAFTVGSITFNSGAGAFTLGGSVLTLASGGTVTNNSTSTQTIANSGGLTLSGGSTWNTASSSGNLSVSGAIGGSGSLTKSGSGTLTLSGANTYTGGTTLSAGTLALGSSGALGSTGAITFSGGTLQFSASNTTDYSSRFVNSTGAITIDTNGQTVGFASAIGSSNTGGLTKLGSGLLTIDAIGQWSGPTTILGGTLYSAGHFIAGGIPENSAITVGSGGTLLLGGNNNGVSGSAVTIQAGGTVHSSDFAHTFGALALQGGTLSGVHPDSVFGSFSLNGNVNHTGDTTSTISAAVRWAGTRTFDVADGTPAVDLLVSGTVGDSISAGSLIKSGAGTLSLTGANSLTGNITLSAGTLVLGNASALGAVTLIINGGVLDNSSGSALTLSTDNAQNWNADFSFTGTNSLNLGVGAVTLGGNRTVTVNANTLTVGGAIGDDSNGYALVKAGSGTLALSGANTYTGGTTVSAGTLAGTTTSLQGAIANNGNVTFNQTSNGTYAGVISGNGTLTKSGTGAVTLSGANTYTGGTTVSAGTLIGTTTSLQGAILNNATVTFNQASNGTYAGVMSGTGILTKSGSGTLTLSGADTYTGGTTLSAGTLALGSSGALGTTGAIAFSGGTLQFTPNNTTDYSSRIANSTGPIAIDTNGQNVTFASSIASSNTGGLTKLGSGTLSLFSPGHWSGPTVVSGGTLQAAAGSIGNPGIPTGSAITVGAGGTLSLIGGFNAVFFSPLTIQAGGLVDGTGSHTITTLTLQGGTLTGSEPDGVFGSYVLNGNLTHTGDTASLISADVHWNGSRTFDVADGAPAIDLRVTRGIGDANSFAALIKTGAGTLSLEASDFITSGITVSAGTLAVGHASALGFGALTMNGGALDNSGGGALTIATDNVQNWNADFAFIGTNSLNLGTGAVTLGGNRTVTVNASTLTVGGAIGDGGSGYSLTKAGAGTLALGANATYTGSTTVTGGLLQISANAQLNTGALTLDGGGIKYGAAFNDLRAFTLGSGGATFDTNGFNVTYTPVISGSGSLTKSGAGSLALAGANTYGGGTTILAGTLALGHASALGTGVLAIGGGAFDNVSGSALTLAGNNAQNWNGDFSFAGTNGLDLGTGAVTLGGNRTVTVTANTLTVGGVIGDSASGYALTKAGAGALVLGGANTYSGGTTISAGTLALAHASALGTGALTIGGGALDNVSGSALTLAGNSAQNWNGDFSFAGTNGLDLGPGAVTLGGNRTVTVTANTLTVGGAIGDGGSGYSLAKSGVGTLTLSGTNSYTGGTTVSAGTLQLGNSGTILADAGGVVVNGGTLALGAANEAVGSLSGAGGTIELFNGSGRTLSVNQSGAGTFAGVIQGSGGALVKAGAGTLTLSGANTYTGGTTVSAGTLALGASERLADTGALTVNGGTFALGSFNETLGAVSLQSGSITGTGTLTGSSYDLRSGSVSAILGGSAAVAKSTSGTVAFSGANTYSGGTSITGGLLQIGANSQLGSGALTLDGGGLKFGAAFNDLRAFTIGSGGATLDTNGFNVAESSVISGSGGLTKSGAGLLALSGANTYAGGTTLSAGTLALGHASALGTGALTINAGALDNASGSALTLSTNNAQNWNADIGFAGTNSLNLGTGAVTLGANRTVTVTANTLTVGGAIGDGGSGYALTKAGAGTLVLGGANTYSGGTTLSAGTLAPGHASALGTGALTINGGALDNLSGGALTLSTNNAQNWNANISFTGTNSLDLGAGTVTLGGNRTVTVDASTLTVGGAIGDGGNGYSLVKAGGGTLTLFGANTYTGGTTVSAGTLALGASERLVDTGALTVNGGTFALGSFNETLGVVSLQSGSITGTGMLAGSSYDVRSGTIAAPLGGSAALTKSTAGTVTLSGANSYSGGTTVSAGTLALGANERLADTGALTVNGGTFALGSFNETVGAVSLTSGSITGTGTLTGSSYDLRSGSVSAILGGSAAVTKSTSGTVTLSGANTYAGGTSVTGGLLQIGANSQLGSGALTLDGGGIKFGAAFNDLRAFTIGSGGGTLDSSTFNVTYGQVISGNGTLTITGPGGFGSGSVTLTANNTYAGGTIVAPDGMLGIGNGGTTGSVGPGPIWSSWAGRILFNRSDPFTLTNDLVGPRLTTAAHTNLTLTGTLSAGGQFVVGDNSVLRLAGAGPFPTNSSVALGNNGRAEFASDTGGRFFSLDAGASSSGTSHFVFDRQTAGAAPAFSMFYLVAGQNGTELRLSPGANVTSGTVNLLAGNFQASGSSPVLNVESGVQARISQGFLGEYTFEKTGGGTLVFGWNSSDADLGATSAFVVSYAELTISGGTLQFGTGNNDSGDFQIFVGYPVHNNAALAFNFSDNFYLSANVDGTGSLTQLGTGTLHLPFSNSYSGATLVSAGTLMLDGAGALPAGTPLTVSSGATLDLNGNAATVGKLEGAGTVSLQNATLTVAQAGNSVFAGALSGSGELVKSGAGTLALSGTSTYGGATAINAGTLLVDGSLTQSAVTVNSGGTLGGSGTLGALATIAGGGHLAPGDSPGTITFTNGLTLASGSVLDFQVGTLSDMIRVSGGTLTGPASGTITLNLSNASVFTAGIYTLFDFTNASTSDFDLTDFTFGTLPAGSPANYSLGFSGSHLDLTYTGSAIPEPSTYAAIFGAAGLAAAVGWRRRRQRGR